MFSNQYIYDAYIDPTYRKPYITPVEEDLYQSQSYQVNKISVSSPEIYQTEQVTYNQSNNLNEYNNIIGQSNQIYTGGEANTYDVTNIVGGTTYTYDVANTNTNTTDYTNQIDSYNHYDITNVNQTNFVESTDAYIPPVTTNVVTSYYQTSNNVVESIENNNLEYQPNEIKYENNLNIDNQVTYEKPFITPVNDTVNVVETTTTQVQETINNVIIDNPIESAFTNIAKDVSEGNNQINQVYSSNSDNINVLSSINTVNSTDLNKLKNIKNIMTHPEFKNSQDNENEKDQKKLDSPRLVNTLMTHEPPTLLQLSKNSNLEKEDNKEEEEKKESIKKVDSKILTLDEKILLSEKDNYSLDFNIKKHYEVTVVKEPVGFNYKKIHKKSLNLLSHFEMPRNYEYTSPLLSPDIKYLACIAHGEEDFVYIWEMKDLYWYRYKIAASRVDGISFTPDSKAIIIVYRYSNPIMYDLGTGKKLLEFEKNGEENNRAGFLCTYTDSGSHFAYTSNKSFTLWSLATGKIKQQIMNDSPIKIISNEFLICISSDLNCDIIKIANEENIISFKLKGVESLDDILDARCAPNMTYLLYVTKKGILKYVFLEQEYKGVQKYNFVVEKASISDDCKYVMKTNMNHVSIHDLEKQNVMSTFLQEKFKEYRIDFTIKRLIIIDDISITVLDYTDEEAPEKYVWLNKNPTKIEDVRFSRDCKILLARVNRNNAIAYDLKTGFILKKWQNIDENWLDFAITKHGGDKVATKSHLLLVRIWNFSTGREDASFYGFDSHSLAFSASGNYLACGTKVGPEIARIWDIDNQKYGIFRYNGKNNNYHTVVHLTSPEPIKLICCSIDQPPLVFDSNTKQLLVTCDCIYRFEEIYEIDSDLRYDVFIVKGRDEAKRNIGILYRLSDGALLEAYENYTVLELAKNTGVLISKCENVNNKKLTSTNIKNLGDPILNDFNIQADNCKLLNDNKCAVIEFGDDNNKEYNLINVENGTYIGKFVFTKKNFERKSAAYITVDPVDNEIYFRYFEFLSPQETMIFKKKNIFNVEDETE